MSDPNKYSTILHEKTTRCVESTLLGLYSALIFAGVHNSMRVRLMFAEGLAKIAETEQDTYAQRKQFLDSIHEAAIFELGLMKDRV